MMEGKYLFMYVACMTLAVNVNLGLGDDDDEVNVAMECGRQKLDAITYDELLRYGGSVFQKAGTEDYSNIELDSKRHQVIVGAKDNLFRLGENDLNELQAVEWRPDDRTQMKCASKGESLENCCNFIRVLLPKDDSVFTCGTYAFSPQCTWRKISNLTEVSRTMDGIAKCPYNPHHNATALLTSSGDLYSGTVMDFMARDPVVYRTMGPSPQLRTAQLNSKWLNEPNFVASFEIDPYIYIFFRETAVEYTNCGKAIYSRVARVCKNDTGGEYMLIENWTTYVKARLNCSIPGEYPFYFHEIQSAVYDNKDGIIYGVFTTQRNGMSGSAVCAFDIASFDNAFEGPYKVQHKEGSWGPHPNNSPNFKCHLKEGRNKQKSDRSLKEAARFQLMDRAVQPLLNKPVHVEAEGEERVTQVSVDKLVVKGQSYRVVFLGTEGGKVKKVVTLPGQVSSCVVEEIHLMPEDEHAIVKTVKLDVERGMLYVGLQNKVMKVPVQRCGRFITEVTCLNAMDPYCGWQKNEAKCVSIYQVSDFEGWIQDMSSCPILSGPIDGGYSKWSDWANCNSPNGWEQCMCRTRICDSPAPKCGGMPCLDASIEVVNCTGTWGDWEEWTECSAKCNGGFRSHTRKCPDGKQCVGNSIEWEECNTEPCPDKRRTSPWTSWTVTNITEKGYMLRRVRFMCRAPVPEQERINVARIKESQKTCRFDDKSCWDQSGNFGGWTAWSEWKECSVSCGDGVEVRYRGCFPGSNLCIGPDYETRSCSRPTCPVNGGWSCWTAWGECTAKISGTEGLKQRYRQCTNPEPAFGGTDCVGNSTEIVICIKEECKPEAKYVTSDGFKNWNKWTKCSAEGKRHRSRQCSTRNPSEGMCLGCAKEIEYCHNGNRISRSADSYLPFQVARASTAEDGREDPAEEPCKSITSLQLTYLILISLGSALIGAVLALSCYFSYEKCKKRNQKKPQITQLTEHEPELFPEGMETIRHSILSRDITKKENFRHSFISQDEDFEISFNAGTPQITNPES
ncbi:semaphorin-5A-like isoform X2 [Anneissia japonica]|uniref:semaphorin-5A-like isoform X2 n=1 Tax=Anneissia japonica TaxID=1529436 RepID=UPI0014256E64|nr:semaphorin-5A-like isoform X2 [Anneissia japonica]